MRLRVVLLSMALVIVVAGNARAFDGTGVIYDLSTMRTQTASKPNTPPPFDPHDGEHDRRDWGQEHGNDPHDNGRDQNHDPGGDNDVPGDDGNDDPGHERQGNPSPTPEPGTLLLLGGGLAAGIRRFRKR